MMPTIPIDLGHLEHIDNVDQDYRHVGKEIVPAAGLPLPASHLKWYEVRRPGQVIDEDIRAEARGFVATEVTAGRLAIAGELGFTILHLCGDSFYYLVVCTWRNNNEMWQTGYAKETRQGGPFTRVTQGSHLQILCVWELGAVVHERAAWIRYLRSARDLPAKIEYLEDQYTGPGQ